MHMKIKIAEACFNANSFIDFKKAIRYANGNRNI